MTDEGPARRRSTLIGGIAVLMWATLALLATATGTVPPFQLVAMAFALGALLALGKWLLFRESPLTHLRQPASAWLLGTGGLFGYHFFYFFALRTAPAVEANLINYTWPLLIVLFSAALPGERLRWWHIAGASMGLAGAGLLIGGGAFSFEGAHAAGYGAAFVSALIWSGYSVTNRRYASVPTDAVGGFCAATAILAVVAHLSLEQTHWPATAAQWLAVAALGLGPVGAAFFLWDHGTKHGDIRALGAFAYMAPLLSTLLLIVVGEGRATAAIGVACVLITGGAVLAGRELWAQRTASPP